MVDAPVMTPADVARLTGHTDVPVTPGGIAAAVASLRAICGWHIAPLRTETLRLSGSGNRLMVLPTLRLTDVESLSIDGTVTDAKAFEWSPAGIVQLNRGMFPRRLGCVSIRITHGFDPVPEDMAGVIAAMAERGAAPEADMQVGGIAVHGATGLAPRSSEWIVVNRYRLPGLP